MRSSKPWAITLADRWDNEAFGLEKMADARSSEHTEAERKLLRMHARVKRGCAQELRTEARKLSNG